MALEAIVAPEVRRRIEVELARIETEHGVRIVLAVESGSRAWGFPSADSDYDVRFIYAGTLDHYLSLGVRRDVIERAIAGTLDIGGWDLRKALQLAIRSNAVVGEWLASPIRYRDAPPISARLLEIVTAAVHLPSVEYHYDRLARRALARILDTGMPRLKTYCYAIRPVLALRWLRERRTPPPMDLSSLMAGADVPPGVARVVNDLVASKLDAREDAAIARAPVLDGFLQDTLAREVSRPSGRREPLLIAGQAQRFFTSVVLRSEGSGRAGAM
jgi:predicted nucleotidyltransferase